ncbi:bacteriorhodopsin [Halorientalis pallida]|uniref:bacteriorhodopsin n=1 Tax=Halorientalis pallida TaxID=2479928 RepID=UPI003C702544
MLFEEQTLYTAVAIVALLLTVVLAAWVRRFEGTTRRHMLLAPAAMASLTVSYVGMATGILLFHGPEGAPVYVTRFLDYGIIYAFIAAYTGQMANADRRVILSGVLGLWAFSFGAMIRHLAPPPFGSIASLLVLSGFAYSLWLLLRPYTRAAASVSDDRRLLFGKLRNVQLIMLITYLLVALTTRQALGLLGAFTGIYVSAYLDLFSHVALVGLIVRSEPAIRSLTETHPSPLSFLTGSNTQRPTADAPADD